MAKFIDIMDQIPKQLFDKTPKEVSQVFAKPSLLHLKGKMESPLFVSLLLHGNETTGWLVLQRWLKRYEGKSLPRSLVAFIGNVRAAEQASRVAGEGLDFNRIWAGGTGEPFEMAQEVLDYLKPLGCYACIDIHNNTGPNPLFCFIADLSARSVNLASRFSTKILYTKEMKSALVTVLSQWAPSVVIECGLPGSALGVERACHFVDETFRSTEISSKAPSWNQLEVLEFLALLNVDANTKIGFGDPNGDINLIEDFDQHNFTLWKPGKKLGSIKSGVHLQVRDLAGNDFFEAYFHRGPRGELILKQEVTPAMLTKDISVIRNDCLGYFLRRRLSF